LMFDVKTIKRKAKQSGKAIAVCSVALVALYLLSSTDLMVNMDSWLSDLWQIWLGERDMPQPVVLVTVDERTLHSIPDPFAFWSPHFARAIGNLKELGATAIGLDFLFQVSVEDWLEKNTAGNSEEGRIYDVPLRMQLADGRVVLATALAKKNGDRAELILPDPGFLFVLTDIKGDTGVTTFFMDSDSVVRRWVPYFGSSSGPYLSFGMALALKHLGLPPERLAKGLEIGGKMLYDKAVPRYILYLGPPGTFRRVSLLDLLSDDALSNPEIKDAVEGRIAILGADFNISGDVHVTPYNRSLSLVKHQMMSGMELHANIVSSILSDRNLDDLATAYRLLIFLVLGMVMFHLWNRFSPFSGLGLLVLAAAGLIGLGYLLFSRTDLLMPAASGVLFLVIVYGETHMLRLTREERLRSQVRHVFDKYVSPQVVEVLLRDPKSVDIEGEELTVAVLFADIRNFTALSEKYPAKYVVELLNSFFDKICDALLDQGGTIDKFMGDGIMVLFGAPVHYPDHTDRALRAIAMMVSALKEFQEEIKLTRNIDDFDIGIGLHTGKAVVGNIGSTRRKEYTAIGDDVNLASRVEALTRKHGVRVLVTDAVVESCGLEIQIGEGVDDTVKGKTGTVRVYPLLGVEGKTLI